jgi:hypothetical protein
MASIDDLYNIQLLSFIQKMHPADQAFLLPMIELIPCHVGVLPPEIKEILGAYCDYLKENGRVIEAHWWEKGQYKFMNFLISLKRAWD